MKRALTYTSGIVGLAIGLAAGNVVAQTTANGPYYANPSWDQQLPASTRFIVLSNFANAAVLDRETGLVWERSPSTQPRVWESAQIDCTKKTVGGRLGWRLPTVQELASLIDPTVPPLGPTLTSGHPFTNVQSWSYWTATSIASDVAHVWGVDFAYGATGTSVKADNTVFVWCVRGGQGVNPQ